MAEKIHWWDYGIKRITGQRIPVYKVVDSGHGGYVLSPDSAFTPGGSGDNSMYITLYTDTDAQPITSAGYNETFDLFTAAGGTTMKVDYSCTRGTYDVNVEVNYNDIYQLGNLDSVNWTSGVIVDLPSTTFYWEHKDFTSQVIDANISFPHGFPPFYLPVYRGVNPQWGYFADVVKKTRQFHWTRNAAWSSYLFLLDEFGGSLTKDRLHLFLVDTGTEIRLMTKQGAYRTTNRVVYQGEHFVSTLAEIPYTRMNDTRFWNPDVDGFDDPPEPEADDPDDDTSGPSGPGNPQYQYPDDEIDFPILPIKSAISTGFLTMYCPTVEQLQDFVDYLWTSNWVDTIKKMMANPMDAVISLTICPAQLPVYQNSTLKIGGVDTQIACNKVVNQYQILDCGTIFVPEKFGSFLDYSPYTKVSIYLPFVGTRELDVDIIKGASVSLKYYVDLLTGSAIAMLLCSKAGNTQSVYYHFDCNINYQIPVTGANYAEVIKGLLSIAGGTVAAAGAVGGMVATGGIGAVGMAGAMAGAGGILSGAANVIGNKHSVSSHGSLSGNGGLLSNFEPYLIIEHPKQNTPSTIKADKGLPSNISATLSSLHGYTEMEYCHLDGITCTDAERNEIQQILMNGIIL